MLDHHFYCQLLKSILCTIYRLVSYEFAYSWVPDYARVQEVGGKIELRPALHGFFLPNIISCIASKIASIWHSFQYFFSDSSHSIFCIVHQQIEVKLWYLLHTRLAKKIDSQTQLQRTPKNLTEFSFNFFKKVNLIFLLWKMWIHHCVLHKKDACDKLRLQVKYLTNHL